MKAAVIYNAGGPEQLSIEDRSIPYVSENHVLVKIKAFGLNRSELMTRKGFSPGVKFPRVLGIECVGEIVADSSSEWLPGQKVAACMGGMGRDFDGSYAEYAVLPKSIIYPFESSLPWPVLGSMPEMFFTVDGSLHSSLQVVSGETLLIRGGTSSIGLLSLQLAKNLGLTVVTTTRKSDKRQFLLDMGADHVVIDDGNIQNEIRKIMPLGVDKVLELVGTSTLKDSLASAKTGGTICMTGMLSESWSIKDFAPMEYIPSGVKLTIFDSGQVSGNKFRFQKFITEVESGKVQLNTNNVFKLDQIVTAHQLMDSNKANGKIVIVND
jgi:NADPH:quinone reductase